jgi:hypothetical protein
MRDLTEQEITMGNALATMTRAAIEDGVLARQEMRSVGLYDEVGAYEVFQMHASDLEGTQAALSVVLKVAAGRVDAPLGIYLLYMVPPDQEDPTEDDHGSFVCMAMSLDAEWFGTMKYPLNPAQQHMWSTSKPDSDDDIAQMMVGAVRLAAG